MFLYKQKKIIIKSCLQPRKLTFYNKLQKNIKIMELKGHKENIKNLPLLSEKLFLTLLLYKYKKIIIEGKSLLSDIFI